MTLSLRPDRRRHRRPLVVIGVVSAVLLLCTGASTRTPVRPAVLVPALILAALPILAAAVLAACNVRNVALYRHADGSVESVSWSGRRTTVQRPDTVRLHTIRDSSNLLVITARDVAEPIVLVPQWWRKEDLDALTTAIHVPIDYAEDENVRFFTQRYPRAGLPLLLRYPLALPLTIVLLSTAAVIVWVALLNQL
ncbi:hypothetical protein Dvina_33820 [Dactylosporangium vinaceum]|uniref:PH domain-containing protein n=1 Tax=Dactylosporangium vinaceum TaxID=53362 RepID=A0ABV5MMM0_9ACTN|nr:hypothetical protein [Dactylosporangium vinaceum]UAB93234.1 hypothetical protein Dvina_33820 [Dactylosporangium vinaceum]